MVIGRQCLRARSSAYAHAPSPCPPIERERERRGNDNEDPHNLEMYRRGGNEEVWWRSHRPRTKKDHMGHHGLIVPSEEGTVQIHATLLDPGMLSPNLHAHR